MKITREDVQRVAELAHLELSESEVETYLHQLDAILTYIGKLNELDTRGAEPMAQVLAASGAEDAALREDIPREDVSGGVAESVLAGAPDPNPPYFRVPKVIER